jgi:galactokinase
MFDAGTIGVIVAATLALVGTVVTAKNTRKVQTVTAAQAAEVADRESFRLAQDRLMSRLQMQLDDLQEELGTLRVRLRDAERDADSERMSRRSVERNLASVQDQLARIITLLRVVPEARNLPELARIMDASE